MTTAGRDEDSDITSWILGNAGLLRSVRWAAITVIDSGSDPSSSPQLAAALKRTPAEPGGPLSLSGAELVQLALEGHFNGFDVVWLFERDPGVLSDAPCPGVTGERLTQVEAWVESSGAVVGLSDGMGWLDYLVNSSSPTPTFRFGSDIQTQGGSGSGSNSAN